MSSILPAGTHLGRYQIRSRLGAGGMGEVYSAQDTKLDRKVALKILPAALSANQDRMRRRFWMALHAEGVRCNRQGNAPGQTRQQL